MSDTRQAFFVAGPSYIEDGQHRAPVCMCWGGPYEVFNERDQIGDFGYEPGAAGNAGCYDGEYQHFCEFVCEGVSTSEFYMWDDAEKAWWGFTYADWSTFEGPDTPTWKANRDLETYSTEELKKD